ncbi:MAG: discoidin domain-containing protein [Planctomycetota bacterium]
MRASAPVWIETVRAYPNIKAKSVRVHAEIRNITAVKVEGPVVAKVFDADKKLIGESVITKTISPGGTAELEFDVKLDGKVILWDEFNPSLYDLELTFADDTFTTVFGMRQVGVKDKRIAINDRPVFLRGTLECCIFPLAGYPPTDVAAWERIYKITQSYGLNHMRFHSWCPPRAAFVAADKLGVYLQVELPAWTSVGVHEPTDQFWREELDRILDTYGDHPSFTFMCMGNELTGEPKFLTELINRGKARDGRHLYSGRTAFGTVPGDEYYVTHYLNDHVRGIFGPGTDHDFSKAIAKAEIPIISHEIGQWCVYPDYSEMNKYTGHLKPRNLGYYRESLEKNNMLSLNKKFQQASGALSMLLYKEEMEAALRTPGFDGFQLLDLHDFPGQGTALVGVLDAFWDSKGIVTPEEFRRYCSQTVPLLRMSKRVWTNSETFTAKTQIAHFGAEPIEQAILAWSISGDKGSTVASGELDAIDIPIGNDTFGGEISASLNNITVAGKFTVRLGIRDTDISNSWEIWVYPDVVKQVEADDILVADQFDKKVQEHLDDGDKVLLSINSANQNVVGTNFEPIFWCGMWFTGQDRQLGILCDPSHPALAGFPTDFHTNWQWYHLLKGAKSLDLAEVNPSIEPVVRIVDDWNKNRPLGLIFEAKVGKGKLIVCGIDIQGDALNRPEVRQLRQSMLAYMKGSKFDPTCDVSTETLAGLFEHPYLSVEAVSSENPNGGEGRFAVDGDPMTMWFSRWEKDAASYPHSITLRLKHEADVSGLIYQPRNDGSLNGWIQNYEIHISSDGKTWGQAVKKGSFEENSDKKTISFDRPQRARFIRFTALKGFEGRQWACIVELDVIFTEGKAIAMNKLVGKGNARVDNHAAGHEAINAIDGKADTIWHTEWQEDSPGFPHLIQIDTQNQTAMTGIRWLPRQDMFRGLIKDYEIYISTDGKTWGDPVLTGSFEASPNWMEARFDKPVTGRYLRLKALTGYYDQKYVSIAEIEVLTN